MQGGDGAGPVCAPTNGGRQQDPSTLQARPLLWPVGGCVGKTACCVLVPVLDSASFSADHNADQYFPPITCHPPLLQETPASQGLRGSKLARPCLSFPGQRDSPGRAEVLQSPRHWAWSSRQPPARSGAPRTLLPLVWEPSRRTPTPTSTWAHPGCAPSTRAVLGQEQVLSKRLSPEAKACIVMNLGGQALLVCRKYFQSLGPSQHIPLGKIFLNPK